MIGQTAKAAALVFAGAIVQASILNGIAIFAGTPDVLLVLLVAVAFVSGSVYGASMGFFAGLLLDIATLSTLGVTSLLLTVTGYWCGRYGETTGRDKGHAPVLAVAVATILFGLGALGLRFVLGEHVDDVAVLSSLPASALLNVVLMVALFPLVRRLLARRDAGEGAQEVQLLG
jgi:rod shape-determining protein MreD